MIRIDTEKVCKVIYESNPRDVNGKIKPVVNYDIRILTSGKLSNSYLDNRVTTYDAKKTNWVVDELACIAKENNADYILSSFDAAVPWGILVADRLGVGFAGIRKKDKGDKFGKIMGVIPEDVERPFGVEDLNTTGKTILHVVNSVNDYGSNIAKFTAIVDREELTPKNKIRFAESGIKLTPVLTLSELIQYGSRNGIITRDKVTELETCRSNPEDFAIKVIQERTDWIKKHERFETLKEFYTDKPKVRKVLEEVIGTY